MDMVSWLRSLGLEKYDMLFRENAVDADVLRDLDETHFKEMGIPLGDRIKLLKAIKQLPPVPTITPASTDATIEFGVQTRRNGGTSR